MTCIGQTDLHYVVFSPHGGTRLFIFGWFIILYLHDHHHIKLRATTKITKVAIIAVVDILVAVDLADYSAFALCFQMQPIVVSL